MTTKIMMINPLGVDIMDRITEEIVAPYLRDDTEVVCTSLGEAAPPTPFLAPLDQIRGPMVERALKAEADGFDVVVISCSGDPCLTDLRDELKVPVVGAHESAVNVAKTIGKLAIALRRLPEPYPSLMPTQRDSAWLVDKVVAAGMPEDQFSIVPVQVPTHPSPDTIAELVASDPLGLRDQIIGAMSDAATSDDGLGIIKAAVADGADAVYYNCTFWGGQLGPVAEQLGAKVLDPLVICATAAEHVALSSV